MTATDAQRVQDARRVMDLLMTEKALQDNVIALAKTLGLLVYHPYDSRKSEPGFPDLTIVGKRRVLFVELKRQTGKLTKEQQAWREAIERTADKPWAPHVYYLWRPHDWSSGEIENVLRGEA